MTKEEEKFYEALDVVRESFDTAFADGIRFANRNKNLERDPKCIGVPNINFSISNELGGNRSEEFRQQRLDRGFDDSETWALDSTIAQFIYPRLKRFKEVTNGVPYGLSEEEWNTILNKMCDAFYILSNDEALDFASDKHIETVKEGLQLFAKYFTHLWW